LFLKDLLEKKNLQLKILKHFAEDWWFKLPEEIAKNLLNQKEAIYFLKLQV